MPAEIIALLTRMRNTDPPESTDALFDTTDAALARRLGEKTKRLMQLPRADVKHTARLAFSYAARVQRHLDLLGVPSKGLVH